MMPPEQPRRTQPPPSGMCRVWLHKTGVLRPLGDYAESSPRAAAVTAFDQLDGQARRTFVCQDSAGTFTAWTVRLRPATPLGPEGVS